MNKEKLMKVMISVSIFIVLLIAIQFVFFIDQFPNTASAWSLTIRAIEFGDASIIENSSYGWMIFLISFNVLTLGLGYFYFKPKNPKLLELGFYNVLLSVMFLLALVLFVNLFPENITGQITNGFLFSKFEYEGEMLQSTNLIYVLTFLYLGLNVTFLNLKAKK